MFKEYIKIKRLGDDENKDIFLDPDCPIVIQEKMDGANFRFMITKESDCCSKVVFGSRTQLLHPDIEHKYAKNFTRCIQFVSDTLNGVDLTNFNNLIFYGECMVAHSMKYDWDKVPPFLGFDIFNLETNSWVQFEKVKEVYEMLHLPMVPLIAITKSQDIPKIDNSVVPISVYAIPSGIEDTRKAEGIVLKNYRTGIFAKYVRDAFKEINAEVFGSKQVKYNGEDNTPDLVFKYCTNARIDKIIFKLLDEGKPLSTTLMPDLIRGVLNDIYEECALEIMKSDWTIDFKLVRRLVPKRCIAVLNQVIANNVINNQPPLSSNKDIK